MKEHEVLRLADGRSLGRAEYGDPDGKPLFFFHGTPGSRMMLRTADEPARRLGIRLIAPDRPGFGLSDFQPGRAITDWPDDIAEVADRLGLERFAVAGISGGGPYASACAWKLPDRVTSAGLVSGMGPVATAPDVPAQSRVVFALARCVPGLPYLAMTLSNLVIRRAPEFAYGRVLHVFASPSDRPILTDAVLRASLIESWAGAFREGSWGAAHEVELFSRPWGFDPADIRVPVVLWHGGTDRQVHVSLGRHLAAVIPSCRAEMLPEAGHYWGFENVGTVLEAVINAAAPTGCSAG